jgi:hypothetical protein
MVLLDSTAPDGSAQAPSTDPGSYDLPGRFSALRPTWAWLVWSVRSLTAACLHGLGTKRAPAPPPPVT